ncbi:MAG: AAA family ATPase, partial [Methanobrevibacter sp.]|nr:AAA family ATPase [Methanobrevibacter sp.]
MKKLPLGISTFSEIIEENYIYVDKTEAIYNMVTAGEIYFLSRPRRFGKSLLVNTLEELFRGNKKLFKNLYIYDKWDWSKKHPVIHLDFGSRTTNSPEKLKLSLNKFLNDTAAENDLELEDIDLIADKFEELIKKLHAKTDEKVVVLIDEYDIAITDYMKNSKIAKQNLDILNNFYKVLKACDKYLKFVFLTGVSKFSLNSIYSGLNNLDDISMDSNFS